jgi:NSS family neurotransmitter:Na+ symporter
MASASESIHGMWSSRLMFILAATGSAVGVGNIWMFPYMAGANGGSAFVLVYLLCVAIIGLPVMMAEVLAGREGRQSPINNLISLAKRSGLSPNWRFLGWMGALTGVLILSFYGVISGWAMAYVVNTVSGDMVGVDAVQVADIFAVFTGDVTQVLLWQGAFMIMTIFIVARGVGDGLEMAVKYLMPALFILIIVLIAYAATTGYFTQGFLFLFEFSLDDLTGEGFLAAMGQAFFTLSLGMGTMIAYGAYMPRDASILGTVGMIAALDTLVALMAGMAIFPLVFANGLEVGAGPGLMFITLPLAFANMDGGQFFGAIFFVLVTFAALTSSISMIEPAVAWVVERFKLSRVSAAIAVGGLAWFAGLGSAFSSNIWADTHFLGDRTFFDMVVFLTSNVLLPLGGFVFAIFAGWFLSREIITNQLELSGTGLAVWSFLIKFIAPVAILVVFVMALR